MKQLVPKKGSSSVEWPDCGAVPVQLALQGWSSRGFSWVPQEPKARLLIVHGMAEHAIRYARFAEVLRNAGIAVYAFDLRGHGPGLGPVHDSTYQSEFGFWAENDGWQQAVSDVEAMVDWVVRNSSSRLPFFLMGHSMGSLLCRWGAMFAGLARPEITGYIFSGTAGPAGGAGAIGLLIARFLTALRGARSRSRVMDTMMFGAFNKAVLKRPAAAQVAGAIPVSGSGSPDKPRTGFEWISRDHAEVDKYVADPYCGGVCTLSFYRDLIKAVQEMDAESARHRIPRDRPVLFFSGSEDPVGNFGAGTTLVFNAWQQENASLKLYGGARHETLNETIRSEVMTDVSTWILSHSRQGGSSGQES